jgi:hypothetical protein
LQKPEQFTTNVQTNENTNINQPVDSNKGVDFFQVVGALGLAPPPQTPKNKNGPRWLLVEASSSFPIKMG